MMQHYSLFFATNIKIHKTQKRLAIAPKTLNVDRMGQMRG